MARRYDDPPHSLDWRAFRSARVFSINGIWYFQTREGFDEGPYDRRETLDDAVERYDPATDTWTVLDPMPTPRHGTGAAPFAGGVLVPGGATVQAFRAVDTVEWLALD